MGCLRTAPQGSVLTDEFGTEYVLAGKPQEFKTYDHDEVTVTGQETQTESGTSIQVTGIKLIFDPYIALSHYSITSIPDWSTITNKSLGITVQYPTAVSPLDIKQLYRRSNFADQRKPVAVTSLDIPESIYSDSDFVGGRFAIFANSLIRSSSACAGFGRSDPRYAAARTINHIQYAETYDAGVASGTVTGFYDLHTYQNGVCFEFHFEFDIENPALLSLPCSKSVFTQPNETDLINSILSRVSFAKSAGSQRKRVQ